MLYAALRRGRSRASTGALVLESDFVSGDHSKGRDTPTGAFGVTHKTNRRGAARGGLRDARQLTVNSGLFVTHESDCYMYKVQDIQLTATLLERVFGLATLTCYTGDVTDSELQLVHIKNAKEIKAYLLKASEEARMKKRTLHTQDIGAEGMGDYS